LISVAASMGLFFYVAKNLNEATTQTSTLATPTTTTSTTSTSTTTPGGPEIVGP